jgi:hypothetical protein
MKEKCNLSAPGWLSSSLGQLIHGTTKSFSELVQTMFCRRKYWWLLRGQTFAHVKMSVKRDQRVHDGALVKI